MIQRLDIAILAHYKQPKTVGKGTEAQFIFSYNDLQKVHLKLALSE